MGEDEQESTCRKSMSRTCDTSEFKCSNKQCISKTWVCDGVLDCSNDEDECRKYSKMKNPLNKQCFEWALTNMHVCLSI